MKSIIVVSILASSFLTSVDNVSEVYEEVPMLKQSVTWSGSVDKQHELALEHLSVSFPMNSDVAIDLDKLSSLFGSEKVRIIGYASPDGLRPSMQESLALRRGERVAEALKSKGVEIEFIMGVVCGNESVPSDCWRADIIRSIK